jgi:hypothetical protein
MNNKIFYKWQIQIFQTLIFVKSLNFVLEVNVSFSLIFKVKVAGFLSLSNNSYVSAILSSKNGYTYILSG